MAEFALLINNTFKELRNYAEKPADIQHKNVTWHDVVRRQAETQFTGLEDGNWVIQTIDPATLPPTVPASITPRQCRLVLMQQGLLPQIEEMIAQSTDDVKITWEYALEFRRDDPLLNQFAANVTPPLTSEQIDQFFIAASQL